MVQCARWPSRSIANEAGSYGFAPAVKDRRRSLRRRAAWLPPARRLLPMSTACVVSIRMSDRVGRRPIYVAGALISAVFAFALFPLLAARDPVIGALTVIVAMSLTHALMFGPQGAFMPELFGARLRYSGASLGCQVAAALSAGRGRPGRSRCS